MTEKNPEIFSRVFHFIVANLISFALLKKSDYPRKIYAFRLFPLNPKRKNAYFLRNFAFIEEIKRKNDGICRKRARKMIYRGFSGRYFQKSVAYLI